MARSLTVIRQPLLADDIITTKDAQLAYRTLTRTRDSSRAYTHAVA
jgi:hypothetical protein